MRPSPRFSHRLSWLFVVLAWATLPAPTYAQVVVSPTLQIAPPLAIDPDSLGLAVGADGGALATWHTDKLRLECRPAP